MFPGGVAQAVYLGDDGLGQALIYPFYTARTDGQGNPYNSYLSVTNTDSVGKAVRVRLLEGSASREVGSFNVFLAPGDMWTGAVVPDGDGAKLITADRSCTEPAFTAVGGGPPELALGLRAAPVATDFAPSQEGFVQMIEMATIKPGSQTALAIASSGQGPANCALVRGNPGMFVADLEPPRGALMGSLTLINVAGGMDATLGATALAALTTQPFFRPAADPYVNLNAPEVTPTSVVTTGGKRYRLQWARGVDAVTSLLMQKATTNEYVLDPGTASLTDWVATMPTREFYRAGTTAQLPFRPDANRAQCDATTAQYFDRELNGAAVGGGGYPPWYYYDSPANCYSASVWAIQDGQPHSGVPMLGSRNTQQVPITDVFYNGWMEVGFEAFNPSTGGHDDAFLDSLPASTVTDLATGSTSTGAVRVMGSPIVGFIGRTYSNGTVTCVGGACQGNYASAFPHHGVRSLGAAP